MKYTEMYFGAFNEVNVLEPADSIFMCIGFKCFMYALGNTYIDVKCEKTKDILNFSKSVSEREDN